jgi:hypothetical protein
VSATAPGPPAEYSRAPAPSPAPVRVPPALFGGLIAAALAGPALLVVADFTTLFDARGADFHRTVAGHANHSWAIALIGLLGLFLGWFAVRAASRPALWGLAALGILAVVIALGFDLPDATATRTVATTFAQAAATPRIGFYLETLGAALMLIAGGGGLLLGAPALPSQRPGGAPLAHPPTPPDEG